jgi:hypothetical protein
MSSSEDRPGWRPEPETSSASGGHLVPDPTSGSAYDPLSAPLPSERAAAAATEVISRPVSETPTRGRGSRRRPGVRRLKRTLRHIDPVSILKLSLFFYTCFLVLWLIVVAIVYSILNSMGLFETIEELLDAFAVQWSSHITLFLVERWAFLIGLTLVVIGALVNVFIAFLYNVAADTVGGVEMTFVEREIQ